MIVLFLFFINDFFGICFRYLGFAVLHYLLQRSRFNLRYYDRTTKHTQNIGITLYNRIHRCSFHTSPIWFGRAVGTTHDNGDYSLQNLVKKDQLRRFEDPTIINQDQIRFKVDQKLLFKYKFAKQFDGLEVLEDQTFNNCSDIVYNAFILFIKQLPDNVIVKALMGLGVLEYNGSTNGKVVYGPSAIFITNKSDPEFCTLWYTAAITPLFKRYYGGYDSANLLLAYREWLTVDEIKNRNKFLDLVDDVESINHKMLKQMKCGIRDVDKHINIACFDEWREKCGGIEDYSETTETTEDNRTFRVDVVKVDQYHDTNKKSGINFESDYTLPREVVSSHYEVEFIKIKQLKDIDPDTQGQETVMMKFRDWWVNKEEQLWMRQIINQNVLLHYKGNILFKVGLEYNTSSWETVEPSNQFNDLFGSLDVETYSIHSEQEEGRQVTYAAGYMDHKQQLKLFYHIPGGSEHDVMIRLIRTILCHRNNGITFYVHNMARFDSKFILGALGHMSDKLKIITYGREMNQIFKIRISKLVGKKYINVVFQDSFYHLPFSLDVLGKKFKTQTLKTVFPYRFPNKDNLFYVGVLPELSFFEGKLNTNDHLILKQKHTSWSLKEQTITYLVNDLKCLYQVVNAYHRSVFEEHRVDSVKLVSISALSKQIYLTKYYKPVTGNTPKIPILKGYLDKWIRRAYKGGIVDIGKHLIKNAYKYDVNSHYPNAMLNTMPAGTPKAVFGNLILDELFGFVRVEVTAPDVKDLRIPILPTMNEHGVTHCPRGTWIDIYFSEELKNAVKFGYKFKVLSAIEFDKGENVFKEYVTELYEKKKKAKQEGDHVSEIIQKLLLNSLYGKTGQREFIHSFKFMATDKVKEFELKNNTDLTQEYGNKTLLRSSGKLDRKITEGVDKCFMVDRSEDLSHNDNSFDSLPVKAEEEKFVPEHTETVTSSCVAIAAAITAYGRIHMSQFKNIPGNDYMGGDTDSVIMEKPLPEEKIGQELGLLKFEFKVLTAILADKKLYYLKIESGQEIIKSRGIGLDHKGNQILGYKDFLKLINGVTVNVKKMQFKIEQSDIYILYQKKNVRIGENSLFNIKQELNNLQNTTDKNYTELLLEISQHKKDKT